jgi:hypothetical protein
MVSAIVAVGAGLIAPQGGAQELRIVCDADRDGAVTADEAEGCAERRFDNARGSTEVLAAEQFAAALQDADGLRRQFAQVDQNGDGRISHDEWLQWFGPAYAEAAKATPRQVDGAD